MNLRQQRKFRLAVVALRKEGYDKLAEDISEIKTIPGSRGKKEPVSEESAKTDNKALETLAAETALLIRRNVGHSKNLFAAGALLGHGIAAEIAKSKHWPEFQKVISSNTLNTVFNLIDKKVALPIYGHFTIYIAASVAEELYAMVHGKQKAAKIAKLLRIAITKAA